VRGARTAGTSPADVEGFREGDVSFVRLSDPVLFVTITRQPGIAGGRA
jgi:hypothetical protein